MLLSELTLSKFGYLPSSLSDGSKKPVKVQCDYCNQIHEKGYGRYLEGQTKSIIKKDACFSCKSQKQHEQIRATGGMKDINTKRKTTNIERYGVVAPANNTAIQTQIRKDNMEKYGVQHHMQRPEIQEKIKQAVKEKYGTENVFNDPEIQKKAMATKRINYDARMNNDVDAAGFTAEDLNTILRLSQSDDKKSYTSPNCGGLAEFFPLPDDGFDPTETPET